MLLRRNVAGPYGGPRRVARVNTYNVNASQSRHNVGCQVGRKLRRVIRKWQLVHRRFGMNEIVLVMLSEIRRDLKLRGYILEEQTPLNNNLIHLVNNDILKAELVLAMKDEKMTLCHLTEHKWARLKGALVQHGFRLVKTRRA